MGDLPRKPSGSDAEAKYAQSLYQRVYGESRLGNVAGHRVINSTNGKLIIPSRASGGGSGASVTQFKLRFVEDDYLVCREWDGTTIGTQDVYVAKPPKLRCSLESEEVWGVGIYEEEDPDTEDHPIFIPYNYTYEPDGAEPVMRYGETVPDSDPDANEWGETAAQYAIDAELFNKRLNFVRHVEADGITEDQRVIPLWLKGDIIYGIEFDDGSVTTEGQITAAGRSIDFLMIGESRQWARI